MDMQTVAEALDATEIDEAYALPFVTMVTQTYEGIEDKDNFASFTERLGQQSDFSAERELFLRYVEENGQMDLVRYLAELGPDEAVMQWRQANAAEQGLDGDAAGEFPNRAEFATDLQTYCGYWDRTDEGWQAFLDAFQDYAESTHGAVATDFFQRAETGEDKHELFAEFGVTFDDAETPAGGDDAGSEDNGQMTAAAEQFGYLWAEFDGSQESWEQSRDWTYGAANDADPALYAALYERFQALEEQPMPERITQLNEWGFNLTATGEDNEYEGIAGMFDEEVIAATTERLTQSAAEALPPDAAEVVGEAFQDVLQGLPWAGDLSQEEIDQVLATVAGQLETSEA